MAEIYKEYKENRICKNNIVKPHVFLDCFMKMHTPIIVYESDDYLSQVSNWSIFDKLQIQNNYIKYTYCEMLGAETFFITGSLLLGSIFSILVMINKVLKTENKECNVSLELTIKANVEAMFRMQKELMDIVDIFTEKYCLEKNKEYKIDYHINNINNDELTKFTNRFLELFVSQNQKSRIPFLSTTVKEIFKFQTFLLTYEKYLVT